MPELTIVFGITNLLAIIFGWWLVDKLNEKRERLADLRRLAQQIADDLERIETIAILYHTREKRNFRREEILLKRLERMEAKILILSRQLRSIDASLVIELRKSITYRNFQTNSFHPQSANSKILSSINAATTRIIEQLYLAH